MREIIIIIFFSTYLYLSQHKYNKTYIVSHRITHDKKYVQQGVKENKKARKLNNSEIK